MTSETDTTGAAFDAEKPHPYVESIGWLNDDQRGKRFAAVVVYPAGAPTKLRWSTIWERRPVAVVEAFTAIAQPSPTPDAPTPVDHDDTHGVGDETDAAFVERMFDEGCTLNSDFERILTIARRGAALAQPVEWQWRRRNDPEYRNWMRCDKSWAEEYQNHEIYETRALAVVGALAQLTPEPARAGDDGWRTDPGAALHIIFDGPPGPEAGRFVEVETPDGRGLNAGHWHQQPDGLWALILPGRYEVSETAVDAADDAYNEEFAKGERKEDDFRTRKRDLERRAIRSALAAAQAALPPSPQTPDPAAGRDDGAAVSEEEVNLLQEELGRRYALTPSATACAEILEAAAQVRARQSAPHQAIGNASGEAGGDDAVEELALYDLIDAARSMLNEIDYEYQSGELIRRFRARATSTAKPIGDPS